jgi:CBS domain-containing protein
MAMTAQSQLSPQVVRPTDPVRTIVTRFVATVGVGESLASAAESLAADEIGAVVVETPRGPVGVLSERDVVRLVATGADLRTVDVGDVMSPELIWAEEHDSVAAVAHSMIDYGIRHIPVMHDHEIVGIVSMRDVLAVLAGVKTR